ncbi:MAG TPA: glycosyltransferase [Crinalium sp.]
MVLISVIIPVYNGEKTVVKTIESVLNQTFSDLELIVINDGSQDATLDKISIIQDSRLKVFSYANAGVSASRNQGIAQASGQYISFLDADDLWTSDKLEAQFKALQVHSNTAVAYSWTDWIDELDQFLRPGGHIKANGNVYEQLLLRDFVESGSNPLIRKDALALVGGFDESLTAAEDWDLWLRLAARYEFVCVPLPQVLYRISANSASSDVWAMEKASVYVLERACSQSPTVSPALKRKVLGNRYQYLTIKAIDGSPGPSRGATAARFLWSAVINDPVWLSRPRLMFIILTKIAIALLLPPRYAQALLKFAKDRA